MTAEPQEDDQVITAANGRVRVFIEEEVADLLADKLLDAELVGDRIRFSFGEQRR
jgi:hypothetical protein